MAFKPVEDRNVGGKFLVFGVEHSGKSWVSQTFPKSAVIDGEQSQVYDAGKPITIGGKVYNNVVFVDDTLDLDTLEEDLDSIIEGELDIESLVVDGETKFYQVMDIGATEQEEKLAKQNGKSVDTRSKWGRVKIINMKLQQAKLTASARGCHIISIAQETEITDDNNKVIGYRPDANKKLPHDYDVVLRACVNKDKKSGKIIERWMEVYKDRTHVTQTGDIIKDCTFDIWKPLFDEMKKNGKISDANFVKDIKNSTASILSNAELATKLAKDVKDFIHNNKTNTDILKQLKAIADKLTIDMKSLDLEDPKKLQELLSGIKDIK